MTKINANFWRNSALSAVFFTLFSSQAFGVIRFMGLVGQRQGKFSTDASSSDLKGKAVGASLHLDPIPMVPLSIGAIVEKRVYDVTLAEQGLSELVDVAMTPELQAWLPIVGFPVSPFARVGYTLNSYLGKGEIDLTSTGGSKVAYDIAARSQSPRIGGGLKWSPVSAPVLVFNVVFEYSITKEKIKTKNLTPAAGDVTISDDPIDGSTYDAKEMLLGIELGF